MEIKFNKETLKTVGEYTWRFGKKVVVRGLQGIVTDTAARAGHAVLNGKINEVKQELTFDAIVGPKPIKSDKPKKKWFGKKEKVAEEVIDEITAEAVEEKLEEAKELIEDAKKGK